MPATLVEEPLGVACTFSNGTQRTFCFTDTANAELARELLVGLAELVHPHGQLDAGNSVASYVFAAGRMVKGLTALGHRGGVGRLSRARLAEYWMGVRNGTESSSRRMLAAFDAKTGGLAPDVRELVSGRHFNPGRNRSERPLVPYSEAEWAGLRRICTAITGDAFTAHNQALAAAELGQDPLSGGWTLDNICWLLRHHGPLPNAMIAEHMGVAPHTITWHWGGSVPARKDLYPHPDVVLAYRLLFGMLTGIVPDGIDDLGAGDLDWTGDATVLLRYVKGRTSTESLTLPQAAVRLLEQWLRHSALLRRWAPEPLRNALWLRFQFGVSGPFHTDAFHRNGIPGWVARHRILGDDGQALRIHRHRIRTTFESLRDRKAWFGSTRATIDPNHSPAVEGDHYLTAATPAQRHAVDELITQAQTDLMGRARPQVLLSDEQTADLAARFPDLVARMELDDAAIGELVGGQRDVFVAACADPLSGLHGPPGKPCPARPWVCLLCPLAIFAPRHAVNLLRLKAFFARHWRAMPAAQFMAVFGPYATRIDQILDQFDPAVLAASALHVADIDSEIPLRPEETTS